MKYKLCLFFCLIVSIIAGYYCGNFFGGLDIAFFSWLGNSKTFGFDSFGVQLGFMDFSLSLHCEINVMQLILMFLSFFIAPRVADKIKTK